ncbi:hypothetical protein [Cellulomonas sp. NS3]|uniref:hypothetical protein n=1 Tax=Cellulomonas sp. NS3 TaxID=2973977 RepID=UPI002163E398|nr:hypothetical protein [Cellulomonas sp. NS3]
MGEQAALSWNSGAPRWRLLANEVEVPPAREQPTAPTPVPCVARLVWEDDGPEVVETEAIGWTPAAVLVRVYDRRWRLGGVWVPVSDVRRRGTG